MEKLENEGVVKKVKNIVLKCIQLLTLCAYICHVQEELDRSI